jgi:hypothetical protein
VSSLTAKKVIEPYMKPVYGAITDSTTLSVSPDQHHNQNQSLLS